MTNPMESILKAMLKNAFDKEVAAVTATETTLEAKLEGNVDQYVQKLADDAAKYAVAHGLPSATVLLVEKTLVSEAQAVIASYGPTLVKDTLINGKELVDKLLS